MKYTIALVVFSALVALSHASGEGTTPMARVASLLAEMKTHIEEEGKLEQESYDKYACWCEDTMGRKASDISTGKQSIEDLGALILRLKHEIASHGAEIKAIEEDMSQNTESQREAEAVRDKEKEEFEGAKTESEQCTGALEAAIKVLTGAGEGKKQALMETGMREAQLLSVVAGVRSVLEHPTMSKAMSSQDMDLVKRFVDTPQEFVGGRASAGFLSATQVGNNPFGDYAPQSTQIQGILKGMYDSFVGDMEKNNADESDAQKSHEALMATKQKELDTLQATLDQQNLDQATKSENLANSQTAIDDTKAELAADEKLFEETKVSCKSKATEWNERTRLRTEELAGIGQAVQILTSDEAKGTFENATTTFVQISAVQVSASRRVLGAYTTLSQVAAKVKSFSIAKIAADLKTYGHFDKVMGAIDKMKEKLRKEEQDDIAHRDRCQNAQGKNKNDMDDLDSDIEKADGVHARLDTERQQHEASIATISAEIQGTKGDMNETLKLRMEAKADFRRAMKADQDSIDLLDQALVSLKRFYSKNKIDLALLASAQPEYTEDPDKAPETVWDKSAGGQGPAYGGMKGETTGVVAIIEMIKEDLQKEMKTARADDAKAQAQYEKERGAMQDSLDAQSALKLNTEKELSETKASMIETEDHIQQKEDDLRGQHKLDKSLVDDCSWVATHFESRRDKRKAEMDGLEEAKGYLSGAVDGSGV